MSNEIWQPDRLQSPGLGSFGFGSAQIVDCCLEQNLALASWPVLPSGGTGALAAVDGGHRQVAAADAQQLGKTYQDVTIEVCGHI